VRFASASPDDTVAAARAASAITHGDPAAGWGTALYHLMIRAALRGDDPFAAIDAALAGLPDDQTLYVTMLAPGWQPARGDLPNGTVWTCLAQAVWAVRRHDSFAGAVVAAIELGGDTDTVAAVAGGLAGATHGIQGIPSRWTTYLHGHVTTPQGRRTYRLADLHHLAFRLLGKTSKEERPMYGPQGPTEIAPGLYAADLGAAVNVPLDRAVISLCRVGDHFGGHPVRREVYLIDDTGDHNLDLTAAVDDVVATIDAFQREGRQTIVHCHGGASRTGLVLRAWLMHHHGWDAATATSYVRDRWPALSGWNDTFTEFLNRYRPRP
jgi:ADP-ribosyl-[dinitrogen reductase] hydrolase